MEHLSEVLKILDGALKANASMAANYAGLLADKLESEGQRPQARMVREHLARSPQALASAQDASRGASLGRLPTDSDSRLNTVDVSQPQLEGTDLILPDAIESHLKDFIDGVLHHDLLAQAGASTPNRLLIYGLPGTGKTQTSRWIAAKLKLPLLTTRCDTLVSSLLGQTSRNIRQVFDYAQQLPCILFLDEFDALAGARGNERDVGELQRVVIALLQNIDALPDNVILLAATNHEQLLDTAIWRRFPMKIHMPLPDMGMIEKLFLSNLNEFLPSELQLERLAKLAVGATGATIKQVCLDAKRTAILSGRSTIDEADLLRRLGLGLAMTSGQNLSTIEQEIGWLRNWAPTEFSLRHLSALYGLTVHKISNIIKVSETENDQIRKSKSTPTKTKGRKSNTADSI